MKQSQRIATISLSMALLITSALPAANERRTVESKSAESFAQVSDEQIKTSKPGSLFNIVKALIGGGLMLGASQIPGIKGTGLQAGLMFGALPLAWGLGNDDPVTKVTCFSAATASVVIGGIGGLLTTDKVIGEGWLLEKIPLESFKGLAVLLRTCKGNIAQSTFEQLKAAVPEGQQFNEVAARAQAAAVAASQLQTTAGALAVLGGLTSQLGSVVFDSAGRFTGKHQIALDQFISNRINKLKKRDE